MRKICSIICCIFLSQPICAQFYMLNKDIQDNYKIDFYPKDSYANIYLALKVPLLSKQQYQNVGSHALIDLMLLGLLAQTRPEQQDELFNTICNPSKHNDLYMLYNELINIEQKETVLTSDLSIKSMQNLIKHIRACHHYSKPYQFNFPIVVIKIPLNAKTEVFAATDNKQDQDICAQLTEINSLTLYNQKKVIAQNELFGFFIYYEEIDSWVSGIHIAAHGQHKIILIDRISANPYDIGLINNKWLSIRPELAFVFPVDGYLRQNDEYDMYERFKEINGSSYELKEQHTYEKADTSIEHAEQQDISEYPSVYRHLDDAMLPSMEELTNDDNRFSFTEISAILMSTEDEENEHLLLYGPNGTGKNTLVERLARDTQRHLIYANTADFLTSYQGSAVQSVKDIFTYARNLDRPSIICLDELESIADTKNISSLGNKENRNAIKRLFTELDGLTNNKIYIVALTNELKTLDNGIHSRFRTIKIPLPNKQQRLQILSQLLRRKCTIEPDEIIDANKHVIQSVLTDLAEKTQNWDIRLLKSLVTRACRSYRLNLPIEEDKIEGFGVNLSLIEKYLYRLFLELKLDYMSKHTEKVLTRQTQKSYTAEARSSFAYGFGSGLGQSMGEAIAQQIVEQGGSYVAKRWEKSDSNCNVM